MNDPTVILANLPEPDVLPALAKSINAAFGTLLIATEVNGRLNLASQGREAIFDATGELVGASNAPHCSVPGVMI